MPNLQAGLVIGTYAALPYIHLHLEARNRLYPELPTLVHDDCSHQQEELRKLCNDYGVAFISTPQRKAPAIGDLSAFQEGLEWARGHNIDVLVKLSRRFIPKVNWVDDLIDLAHRSGHHTFSNITTSFDFGFRTECLGLRVKDWLQPGIISDLREKVARNREVFVEGHLHNLARRLNQSHPTAREWDDAHQRPAHQNAYAVWDFMGTDRQTPQSGFLWHNSHQTIDYFLLSNEWGLPYRPEDFTDPNQGGGSGR